MGAQLRSWSAALGLSDPAGGAMRNPRLRKLLWNFAIELVIYAVLVSVYALLVLRLLGAPLKALFARNLVLYAFVSLVLIVVQGAALEFVTSLLVNWFGLERLE
jgi:hypothetical protein